MMRVDTVRALFTYLIAAGTVFGGLGIIYVTRNDPAATDMRLLIGGFVALALQFSFGQEIQARTAKQQSTASTQGAATAQAGTNGGVTTEPYAP
jgi:hypothetical protein